MIWAWVASLLNRARKPDTVRIPRSNVGVVLALVAPTLNIEGVCDACGGRLQRCSPPYIAHASDCSSMDRYRRIERLLRP